MIASLRGRVIGQDEGGVVIDVGGVGFRVLLSTQSLSVLHGREGEVTVLTSLIVRDDSMTLYGFITTQEQQLFERLITVSGVGPKVALSALSAFDARTLQSIIVDEDVARIATISGIGKKTAQRIILELRGALDTPVLSGTGATTAATHPALAQATEALLGMGLTAGEISLALKDYEGDSDDVSALVRHGLKRLGAS
ncbi:MAG: Holliday junction branch migration protein RuvA [Coriobacteriales bacterium]|jgi:Holliday junction DNA helicase RuvA|nr:Holliday junction branch migration protein RuvA [Coriobacteriales bacterium]